MIVHSFIHHVHYDIYRSVNRIIGKLTLNKQQDVVAENEYVIYISENRKVKLNTFLKYISIIRFRQNFLFMAFVTMFVRIL
jgi:hypothetical protein